MNPFNTLLYKVRCTWKSYRREQALGKLKQEIVNYYSNFPPQNNKEIEDAFEYIRQHPLCTFPGSFSKKYDPNQVVVCKEPTNGLLYVVHEGKKLFFRRSYNATTVRYCYCGLLTEQDADSPHCYTDRQFKIEDNDTLFDIGSAEGIIALSTIEKVGHAVLFEKDREWKEALEATFAPWKEKVTIVPKYVSDYDSEDTISIDSYLTSYPHHPDFLKIDVEGAEEAVLDGMKELLKIAPLKIALCTYHKAEDYEFFTNRLSQQGFRLAPTQGVMLFLNDIQNMKPPYFRKGLIKATL